MPNALHLVSALQHDHSTLDLLCQLSFGAFFLRSSASEHILLQSESLHVLLSLFEFLRLFKESVSKNFGLVVESLLLVQERVLFHAAIHYVGLEVLHSFLVLKDDVFDIFNALHCVVLLTSGAQFLLQLFEFLLTRVYGFIDGFDFVFNF